MTRRHPDRLIYVLALSLVVMGAVAFTMLVSQAGAAETQVRPCGKGQNPTPCPPTPTPVQPTPTPTPVPTPTPTPSPGGWSLVFDDQYTTWDPSRYFIYPATWTNPNGTGTYGTDITSNGSYARVHLYTDSTGKPRIGAFCPIPTGSLSGRGDLNSARVEFRIRADLMLGYKGVPLMWPMSGIWPGDAEIDIYESEYQLPPKAYVHWEDGTWGGDQTIFSYPTGTSWQDWHTVTMEWVDGTYVELFLDGVSIGRTTYRIPNTPMHLVMQFETQLTSTKPDPAVSGYVEIDYLRVWVPN
jgi:hypothetical protein